jgi:sporulation protein YlmC with PRC-barrel domain
MAERMKRTTTTLLGAALGLAASLGPNPAAAQSGSQAAPLTAQGGGAAPVEAYTSYLALPSPENVMLRGSLDADELIGGEVVDPSGARIGTVTDLMAGPDGGLTHAALDAGSALGAGSRHVAVDVARLQRTEAGPRTFLLDMDERQLAGLPAYRQTGDRWELIR